MKWSRPSVLEFRVACAGLGEDAEPGAGVVLDVSCSAQPCVGQGIIRLEPDVWANEVTVASPRLQICSPTKASFNVRTITPIASPFSHRAEVILM